jgi:hypothetical protein
MAEAISSDAIPKEPAQRSVKERRHRPELEGDTGPPIKRPEAPRLAGIIAECCEHFQAHVSTVIPAPV